MTTCGSCLGGKVYSSFTCLFAKSGILAEKGVCGLHIDKKILRNLFFVAGGCVVLAWILLDTERVTGLLSGVWSLIAPFVAGAAIAFVFNVPMRAIEQQLEGVRKEGLRRGMSIILTIAALALIIVFVVELLVPQIKLTVDSLRQTIPAFVERTAAKLMILMDENPEVKAWVKDALNLETLESIDWTGILQKSLKVVGDSVSTLMGGAFNVIGNVTSGIVNTVISIVFAIYCLARKDILARQGRRILYSILSERASDETIRIFRLTNSTFSNFFSGQCLEVCILGSMFAVTMTVFRMPYVSLVSVLVAVTAFIPIVGATIGCVFGAFFILVNDPIQAAGFVVMFLVLQQIENNLIYPRVVGSSVGLPSMWTLFSVSIGGKLMGVAGMVLMIPMVSVVYTLIGDYTGRLVRKKGIAPEKLTDQPPELKSRLKEKREIKRQKREAKRAAQLAEMMKRSLHIPDHGESENDS